MRKVTTSKTILPLLTNMDTVQGNLYIGKCKYILFHGYDLFVVFTLVVANIAGPLHLSEDQQVSFSAT
jgi:hypothetical protein